MDRHFDTLSEKKLSNFGKPIIGHSKKSIMEPENPQKIPSVTSKTLHNQPNDSATLDGKFAVFLRFPRPLNSVADITRYSGDVLTDHSSLTDLTEEERLRAQLHLTELLVRQLREE